MVEEIFQRFPALEELVSGLASGVLIKARDEAKHLVKGLLDSERNYIFTADEGYHLSCGENLPPPPHMTNDKNKKKQFIVLVRKRLDYYLSIVLRNLRDCIPKIVGHILIDKTMSMLQIQIIEGINQSSEVLECLEEPEHLRIERETLTNTLRVLRTAQKKLSKEGLVKDDDELDDDY